MPLRELQRQQDSLKDRKEKASAAELTEAEKKTSCRGRRICKEI